MAQWDQEPLGSTGTQVQSPAWYSGLRTPSCRSCGLGHSYGSHLIPGLGTPCASGLPKKKKKKKKLARDVTLLRYEAVDGEVGR